MSWKSLKILQAGYTDESTVVYVCIYIQKQNDNIFYIALKKLEIKLIFRILLKAAKNKLSADKLSNPIIVAKLQRSHNSKQSDCIIITLYISSCHSTMI